MTEKTLEKRLKMEVEKLGGLCLKLQTPGFTGIPDRLVILPNGKIWFVEMKGPGGELSDRQIAVMAVLRSLNCNAFEVTPEAFEGFIKWLKNGL